VTINRKGKSSESQKLSERGLVLRKSAPHADSGSLQRLGVGKCILQATRLGEIALTFVATTVVLSTKSTRKGVKQRPELNNRFHSFLLWSSSATAGREGQRAGGGREEGKKDLLLPFPDFCSRLSYLGGVKGVIQMEFN